MEKLVFLLTTEPRGNVYRGILDVAANACSSAILVVRPGLGLEQRGKHVLTCLEPFLVSERDRSEWPGTKLHGHTARVYEFSVTPASVDVLKRSTEGLYDWQQPSFPEDLCLLRADRSAWLVTIAHEAEAYFEIIAEEKKVLVHAVPTISEILREDRIQ